MRNKNRCKKYCLLALLLVMITSCRKVTLNSSDKPSNEFDASGREFNFPCTIFSSGQPVIVTVPAGAVDSKSYLEFYQYKLGDANSVDSFYVDGAAADINLLVSDGRTLKVPAVVKIPFYFASVYAPSSGYLPYRVHAASYKDLMAVLNDETAWEPMTDFTYDNTTKYLLINTPHLDGIFVVAKHK